MGYRTYIGYMPKRQYNKIKSLTEEQLIQFYNESKDENSYWYKGVYEYGKKLYEFGKYTSFEPPKKSMKSFFKKKELKERYEEYDFYVVTEEFLAYLIEYYAGLVRSYYEKMTKPFNDSEFLKSIKKSYDFSSHDLEEKYAFDFDKITEEEQTQLYKMIEHVRQMAGEWGVGWNKNGRPYTLESKSTVSDSWKYEYAIFELKKIYNDFDWKRNVMIYYGY